MKTSKEPETEIQGNRHVKWQKDRKTEQQQIQRRQRCFWQSICIWESCYCLLPIHMVILARTWDQTHCSGREGKDMEVTRVPDEDGIHHVLLTRCVFENHKDKDQVHFWKPQGQRQRPGAFLKTTRTKTRCIFQNQRDKDQDQAHPWKPDRQVWWHWQEALLKTRETMISPLSGVMRLWPGASD